MTSFMWTEWKVQLYYDKNYPCTWFVALLHVLFMYYLELIITSHFKPMIMFRLTKGTAMYVTLLLLPFVGRGLVMGWCCIQAVPSAVCNIHSFRTLKLEQWQSLTYKGWIIHHHTYPYHVSWWVHLLVCLLQGISFLCVSEHHSWHTSITMCEGCIQQECA